VEIFQIRSASRLGALALVVFWLGACRGGTSTPMASFIPEGTPTLRLTIERVTTDNQPWSDPTGVARVSASAQAATSSSLASAEELAVQQNAAVSTGVVCPAVQGGDFSGRRSSGESPFSKDCPPEASWKVIRHPIAVTVSAFKGADVWRWLTTNPDAMRFLTSNLTKGILLEPLRTVSVRAEDLKLEGVRGAVFKELFEDALSAEAQLHYDIAHGNQGFVFSFVRSKSKAASRLLPLVIKSLARSAYQLPELASPVVEMRIGLQRAFVAEKGERIFFANGLEALINVIENELIVRPMADESLALTVRGEAFFDKLLEPLVGDSRFQGTWSFELSGSETIPRAFRIGAAKMFAHLRPKTFDGVLAAIPFDVFGGVVTSFLLPAEMTPEAWNRIATQGVGDAMSSGSETSGVALIWELSSKTEKGLTDIGVIVANPNAAHSLEGFSRYFSKGMAAESCAGGTVLVASTSDTLLQRMREACEGRSLSLRDWGKGASQAWTPTEQQLTMFLNPGVGLRELMLSGGKQEGVEEQSAGAVIPDWKRHYAQALQRTLQDGEETLRLLPVISYSGRLSAEGGTLAGVNIDLQRVSGK